MVMVGMVLVAVAIPVLAMLLAWIVFVCIYLTFCFFYEAGQGTLHEIFRPKTKQFRPNRRISKQK